MLTALAMIVWLIGYRLVNLWPVTTSKFVSCFFQDEQNYQILITNTHWSMNKNQSKWMEFQADRVIIENGLRRKQNDRDQFV
jgi:hypothetical protein